MQRRRAATDEQTFRTVDKRHGVARDPLAFGHILFQALGKDRLEHRRPYRAAIGALDPPGRVEFCEIAPNRLGGDRQFIRHFADSHSRIDLQLLQDELLPPGLLR